MKGRELIHVKPVWRIWRFGRRGLKRFQLIDQLCFELQDFFINIQNTFAMGATVEFLKFAKEDIIPEEKDPFEFGKKKI